MTEKEEFWPPFDPIDFDKKIGDGIFTDPDTGINYHLHPGRTNFLEKVIGFCPTCTQAYTSRWRIECPNFKEFLGTRCATYWKSIDKYTRPKDRIEYCGHKESDGWIDFNDMGHGYNWG